MLFLKWIDTTQCWFNVARVVCLEWTEEHLGWKEADKMVEQTDKEAPPCFFIKTQNHSLSHITDANMVWFTKGPFWASHVWSLHWSYRATHSICAQIPKYLWKTPFGSFENIYRWSQGISWIFKTSYVGVKTIFCTKKKRDIGSHNDRVKYFH